MKQQMKKMILLILSIYCTVSCTNNHIPQSLVNFNFEKQPLILKTQIWNTEMFPKETMMGLFITKENTNNIYSGYMNNKNICAKAELIENEFIWNKYPEIYLYKEAINIYAYSPYQPLSNIDPHNIPIYISSDASQTKDYMYGTNVHGQRKINKYSPIALLNMKHSLTLLDIQVRLTPGTKSHYYHLKAIQVGNKSGGSALSFKGTLNIQTGEINKYVGTNASTRLNINSLYPLKKDTKESYKLMVIPTSRIKTDGDIEIIFIINDKRYKFLIPAHTEWKKGRKYLYDFLFDGYKILLYQTKSYKW